MIPTAEIKKEFPSAVPGTVDEGFNSFGDALLYVRGFTGVTETTDEGRTTRTITGGKLVEELVIERREDGTWRILSERRK